MEHNTSSEANSSSASQEIPCILSNQAVHHRLDIFTAHFLELYCICPTNAQFMLTIVSLVALLHVSMFIRHPQGVSYYLC